MRASLLINTILFFHLCVISAFIFKTAGLGRIFMKKSILKGLICAALSLWGGSQALAGFDDAVAAANDGKFTVAFDEFSNLAQQGDARAQQALAWIYYEGQGRKKDYEKALFWYQKAAEQGNVSAQINLAQMYAYGKGVAQDFSQAARWWQQLAEQGDARAQSALAELYYRGSGVSKDVNKALALWAESAKQGIVDAQRNLGLLYGKGQAVVQDDVQAYSWLAAAAQQADKTASQSRDYARSLLNDEQYEQAKVLAKEYVDKYVNPFAQKNAKPH
jgi:uncharacterized protein